MKRLVGNIKLPLVGIIFGLSFTLNAFGEGAAVYIDKAYGFQFSYPKDMKVTNTACKRNQDACFTLSREIPLDFSGVGQEARTLANAVHFSVESVGSEQAAHLVPDEYRAPPHHVETSVIQSPGAGRVEVLRVHGTVVGPVIVSVFRYHDKLFTVETESDNLDLVKSVLKSFKSPNPTKR